MKITDFHWEKFSFPFRIPFKNSGYVYKSREGFYLFIEFDFSQTFIGECAPLPGINKESIGDVALELEQIEEKLSGYEFNDKPEYVSVISQLTDSPSLKFAFAQIIDTYLTQNSDLQINLRQNVVISAGTVEKMEQQVDKIVKTGFTTIKLKVGYNLPQDEIALIKKISDKYPDIKLRLDANSALSLDEAREYIDSISGYNIEYFEDPVAGLEEMYQLSLNSSIPVAADLFIKSFEDICKFSQNSNIKHFIIKPMAFEDILFLSGKKFDEDIFITISSTFESFAGRIYNYILASQSNTVHGLATSGMLAENLNDIPFVEDTPEISFHKNNVLNWLADKVLI